MFLQPRSEMMHAVANGAWRGRRQPPEVAALQVELDPLARGCLQSWPGRIQGTLILVDAYQAFELLRLPAGLRCAVTWELPPPGSHDMCTSKITVKPNKG